MAACGTLVAFDGLNPQAPDGGKGHLPCFYRLRMSVRDDVGYNPWSTWDAKRSGPKERQKIGLPLETYVVHIGVSQAAGGNVFGG